MPVCPTCDRELETRAGVRQHHTKVHDVPLANRTCSGCDRSFYDPDAKREHCDSCDPNAGEHNGNWRGGQERTDCENCGDSFRFYPSEKPGRYCPTCVEEADEFLGTQYATDAEWTTQPCRHCDDEFDILRSDVERGRGAFCSRDCYGAWLSAHRTGSDHHQWEGGSLTYGGRWWAVRRQALERDDHACRVCGRSHDEIGREPDVHHVVRVRDFDDPNDAHSLDNVVCLCRSCHRHVEADDIAAPMPDEGQC